MAAAAAAVPGGAEAGGPRRAELALGCGAGSRCAPRAAALSHCQDMNFMWSGKRG